MNKLIDSVPSLEDLGVTRRVATLKNGIRVVLFEKPHAPLVVAVNFLSGARYDPIGKEGIAHFVEHMIVSGTKSFPQNDLLTRYLERAGGRMSAMTSQEDLYLFSGISEAVDFPRLGKFFEETLLHSLFDPKTVEMERGAIQTELAGYQSEPTWIMGMANLCLVFQDTPLARSVIGEEVTVAGITRDDLVSRAAEIIIADRASVTACGGIKLEELVSMLEASVGQLPKSPTPFSLSIEPLPITRQKHISIVPIPSGMEAGHTYLNLSFRIGSAFDPDLAVLRLIEDVIGGGGSSILYTKLRQERGLVYSTGAYANSMADAGSWSIMAATAPANIKETIEIVVDILRETKERGFDSDLISVSQESKVKSMRGRFETSASWVSYHGYDESIGLGDMDIVEYTKAYVSVTNDDVIRVARKYFSNDNWYLTIAGPSSEADLPEILL